MNGVSNNGFRWIKTDIILDFDIPRTLANTIQEIEQADSNNDMVEYNILSDTIDVICKTYCTNRVITKKQWELVCEKFPYVR